MLRLHLDNNALLAGVRNIEKLKKNESNKRKQGIHKYSAFEQSKYSRTMRENIEGESIDPRWMNENVYMRMLQSKLYNQSRRKNRINDAYQNLDSLNKRRRLRHVATFDKIQEILHKLADEVIVVSDGSRFAEPVVDTLKLESYDIKKEFIDQLEARVAEVYDYMYKAFGFENQGARNSAWSKLIQYLIDGSLSYEIVFDDLDNPKKVLGVVETDPYSYRQIIRDGIQYWVHSKQYTDGNRDILLYDSQVAMINWSEASVGSRFSYVEGLLRAFNVSKIMEEAKIIWHVANAQFRLMFVIPTKGKSRIGAATTLSMEQERLEDDIAFDYESGELRMNGEPSQEFMKTYFMSDSDHGRADISSIGGDGPDLSDMSINEYFDKRLYRNAQMPLSRFDDSGNQWSLDATSQMREEITFGRFTNRIRAQWGKLIMKAVFTQLVLDFPDIKDDDRIISAIRLKWASYSIFEELLNIEVVREKIEFIEKMREALVERLDSGAEKYFFSMKFLVEKYLPEISTAELELNDKYLKEELDAKFELMKRHAELEHKLEKANDKLND